MREKIIQINRWIYVCVHLHVVCSQISLHSFKQQMRIKQIVCRIKMIISCLVLLLFKKEAEKTQRFSTATSINEPWLCSCDLRTHQRRSQALRLWIRAEPAGPGGKCTHDLCLVNTQDLRSLPPLEMFTVHLCNQMCAHTQTSRKLCLFTEVWLLLCFV